MRTRRPPRDRTSVALRSFVDHPSRTIAICVAVALSMTVVATRLQSSAATDTFVNRGSTPFRTTEELQRRFGGDAIFVVVHGSLSEVLGSELSRLTGLEQCLAGTARLSGSGGGGRPCRELKRRQWVRSVVGPATFVDSVSGLMSNAESKVSAALDRESQAAGRSARQQARDAGKNATEADDEAYDASSKVSDEGYDLALALADRFGISTSSLGDANAVLSKVIFAGGASGDSPRPEVASLFPNDDTALITIRLKPDLDEAHRAAAIDLVRRVVGMRAWRTQDLSYAVTGTPVLLHDVSGHLIESLVDLLLIGIVVMAAVLAVVFRQRLRLLPLGIALAAIGVVFGLTKLTGGELTLASVAVMPVLLGLGVDYAIQYQSRLLEGGLTEGRRALPAIGVACWTTAAGFGALLFSPVPMVRGFGVMLMAGVIIAFGLAVTMGTAALALAQRHRNSETLVAASVRGAAAMIKVASRPFASTLSPLQATQFARVPTRLVRHPTAVVVVGALLAVIGFGVEAGAPVVSDVRKLVPSDLPALSNVLDLQRSTGVAGNVDVLVQADDVTDPKVLSWIRTYQARVDDHFGYSRDEGCATAKVCPALSFSDVLDSSQSTPSKWSLRALLDLLPASLSRQAITPDRKTTVMTFGIKLVSLDEQGQILSYMRRKLDPPSGVRARIGGVQALAVSANSALADPGRRLATTFAGLLAVALVLFASYRRWRRVVIPLAPILLVTGWSGLVLRLAGIPLNPMSAALGVLVIAVATEFSVLITARYLDERRKGYAFAEALTRTYASTGAAVLASGVTAIAGFAIVGLSDVPMIRDFGRLTVVDLAVALVGVLGILPSVLVLDVRLPARTRSTRDLSPESKGRNS